MRMSKIEIDELKELFAAWGLWSLIDDISDDGDGHGDNLELTREGLEAKRMIDQLLSERIKEAKIEVLEKVLEKKTNYSIEREEHGYRVTLEYVLADDIKKEIKLLKEE